MASRSRKPPPAAAEPPSPAALNPGLPVRLLPHDWPFLYSVLANGDVVLNKRLVLSQPAARSRKRADADGDEAPI